MHGTGSTAKLNTVLFQIYRIYNFLFRKFIETVGIVKPTFFLLENVPNLNLVDR